MKKHHDGLGRRNSRKAGDKHEKQKRIKVGQAEILLRSVGAENLPKKKRKLLMREQRFQLR